MHRRGTALVLVATGLLLAGQMGGAIAAGAAVKVKATSPAYVRVGVVPDAVSVTFTGPLRDDGAVVLVSGPDGVAFESRTEVVGDTLREYLKPGPAGGYVVSWAATAEDGATLEGSFGFTADVAHAGYPAASPSLTPTPSGETSTPSPPAAAGSSGGGGRFGLPRFAVPVGLAVLLVLASGLIAAANRRRPRRSTSGLLLRRR